MEQVGGELRQTIFPRIPIKIHRMRARPCPLSTPAFRGAHVVVDVASMGVDVVPAGVDGAPAWVDLLSGL